MHFCFSPCVSPSTENRQLLVLWGRGVDHASSTRVSLAITFCILFLLANAFGDLCIASAKFLRISQLEFKLCETDVVDIVGDKNKGNFEIQSDAAILIVFQKSLRILFFPVFLNFNLFSLS